MKNNEDMSQKFNRMSDEFIVLVEEMAELDPKLKSLWILIYQNALEDRGYACFAYSNLIQKVTESPESHGLYGDKLAKYLERMSRANDQLLQLSKYISEHVGADENIDADTLYSKIGRQE